MEIRDIALVIIVSSLQKVYTQNKMFTCGETWSETFGMKLFFLASLYYLETTLKDKNRANALLIKYLRNSSYSHFVFCRCY